MRWVVSSYIITTAMNVSSLIYSVAYLTGIAVFAWMARRRNVLTHGMFAIMAAGLVGGLLGANLAQLATGQDGKTVLGGVAGGYLAVILCKRKLGITRPTGDLFAVAWCAGEAVGRWGCFFGGCCYGTECRLPWAVWQHGAFRHPSQIYLSLACLVVLVILLMFDRLHPPDNGLFFLQGLLYCLARFVVEFVREGPRAVAGMTAAQWACAAGFLFFGPKLAQLLQRHPCGLASSVAPEPVN